MVTENGNSVKPGRILHKAQGYEQIFKSSIDGNWQAGL
jgi:hypothetical protein